MLDRSFNNRILYVVFLFLPWVLYLVYRLDGDYLQNYDVAVLGVFLNFFLSLIAFIYFARDFWRRKTVSSLFLALLGIPCILWNGFWIALILTPIDHI